MIAYEQLLNETNTYLMKYNSSFSRYQQIEEFSFLITYALIQEIGAILNVMWDDTIGLPRMSGSLSRRIWFIQKTASCVSWKLWRP